jgi:hypothetical protein
MILDGSDSGKDLFISLFLLRILNAVEHKSDDCLIVTRYYGINIARLEI